MEVYCSRLLHRGFWDLGSGQQSIYDGIPSAWDIYKGSDMVFPFP